MNEHNIHRGNILARRKQVNTLHIFNQNVIEVQHDLEYRINFQVGDQVSLSLQILIPPDFPNRSRPLLRLFPVKNGVADIKLSHPWLGNDNLVIGSPGLNNFGIHSDLGRVVQAVKREFEKNPPSVIKENSPNEIKLKHDSTPTKPPVSTSTGHTKGYDQNCSQIGVTVGRVPIGGHAVIPEIAKLSEEELKTLQTDQLAFNVFSRQLNVTALSSMEDHSENVKKEIMSFVETNAKLANELNEKKDDYQSKLNDLELSKKVTADMKKGLFEGAQRLTKTALCDNLLAASHEDECESEACADQFLSGNLPIDDFLTKYIQSRTQHHVRKTKHDRLMSNHKYHK